MMETTFSVFVVIPALVVCGGTAIYLNAYRITHIRSCLYFGLAGILGISAVAADYTQLPGGLTFVLASLAVLTLGWGLARSTTIDSNAWLVLRWRTSLISFLMGKYSAEATHELDDSLPPRKKILPWVLFLALSGGAMLGLWPSRPSVGLTFIVWGVQLLVASFVFLESDPGASPPGPS